MGGFGTGIDGAGMSFALASAESTDGLGRVASASNFGIGDGKAPKEVGASSGNRNNASKDDRVTIAGVPFESASLVNLFILLASFIVMVFIILRVFQRVIADAKNKRQLNEWQDNKEKKRNVRDLSVFGNRPAKAA